MVSANINSSLYVKAVQTREQRDQFIWRKRREPAQVPQFEVHIIRRSFSACIHYSSGEYSSLIRNHELQRIKQNTRNLIHFTSDFPCSLRNAEIIEQSIGIVGKEVGPLNRAYLLLDQVR